jgi:hypothetical protein
VNKGAPHASRQNQGEPVNGDTTLCGTVSEMRADGTAVTARRFIAATEGGSLRQVCYTTGLGTQV